ncbi:hypothetical protein [Cytophaga aurantiaca]|uniref:hypothetical protein n=1 Tax=Cytophaga aurantiaca TaxID=29530 RepID=UPI000366C276|nr:hypothetical protein [Cytophaga aurantiaca]
MPGLCQTLHKDSIKTDYIEFGSGGGFSGASKNYLLTPSGDLYTFKNMLTDANTLTYIKKVKKCTAKKIFSYANKKQIIERYSYNEPGNMYQYITLSVKNKKKNFVWGSSTSTPPAVIQTLSSKLNNLL